MTTKLELNLLKTLAAQDAEIETLRAQVAQYKEDAERYRWMKENVKRIPLGWAQFGWDVCIDKARKS